MATFKRFEDLPVWNEAVELGVEVFRVTEERAFRFKGDLVNQLRRAALSVGNNIAEGFRRGTTAELVAFLYIARGSAGEVRSMLRFALRLGGEDGGGVEGWDVGEGWGGEGGGGVEGGVREISNLKFQISDLRFQRLAHSPFLSFVYHAAVSSCGPIPHRKKQDYGQTCDIQSDAHAGGAR